jgi:hypothetical protein
VDVCIDSGVGVNLGGRAMFCNRFHLAGSHGALGGMAVRMTSHFLSLSRRYVAAAPARLAAVIGSLRMVRDAADVIVAIVIAVTVVIPIMTIAVSAMVLDSCVFVVLIVISPLPVSLRQRGAHHQR